MGLSIACGAGMIRGSMQVHDEVKTWECSSMDDSPITARRETISNLHPSSSFLPTGNQPILSQQVSGRSRGTYQGEADPASVDRTRDLWRTRLSKMPPREIYIWARQIFYNDQSCTG